MSVSRRLMVRSRQPLLSGTTLHENNLKEVEGGIVLESQVISVSPYSHMAVLLASKISLIHREGVLDTTHEILERLEAHLRTAGQFTVTANMTGNSAEEVAERILSQTALSGLQMGIADCILDLVSSGTTLHENNLKEVEGGVVLESQAVLLASKISLIQREGVLDTTHEILERLEAHLRAAGQFTVTANMTGNSAEEVAERILSQTALSGLQGPTISPVTSKREGTVKGLLCNCDMCAQKGTVQIRSANTICEKTLQNSWLSLHLLL